LKNKYLQSTTEPHKPHTAYGQDIIDEATDKILRGEKVAVVARELGVSKRTLFSWIGQNLNERRELRDALYVDKMEGIASKILAEIDSKDLQETSIRDLMVSLGILLDKRQNLTGPKQAAPGALNLRVAWRDGTGAVEISTEQSVVSAPTSWDHYRGEILEPLELGLNDDDPDLSGSED